MKDFLEAAKLFKPNKPKRTRPPKKVAPRSAAHVAWLKRNGMFKEK